MNVNDSEVVLSVLRDSGYAQTEDVSQADVVLMNTCAIREKAEQRVWQRLAYFRSLRRPGAKTLARPGLLEGHCPSCGASLPIADAAQCAACKSWVNSGEHDWVLVTITQASEWEFPDPDREVAGWPAMRATRSACRSIE